MSALPLGEREVVEVKVRELNDKVFTLKRINGRTVRLLREYQAQPDNAELLWKIAGSCLAGITPDEVDELEPETATKVLELASMGLAELGDLLKAAGVATAPASNSGTT